MIGIYQLERASVVSGDTGFHRATMSAESKRLLLHTPTRVPVLQHTVKDKCKLIST
jgi:hypothetical protein